MLDVSKEHFGFYVKHTIETKVAGMDDSFGIVLCCQRIELGDFTYRDL